MPRAPSLTAVDGRMLSVGLPLLLSAAVLASMRVLGTPVYRVFDPASYLVWHNLVEIGSVAVCFAVFTVSWYSYAQTARHRDLVLGVGFAVVAALDTMHLLGFSGMPVFITPNDPNKATAFWIAGRLIQALTLLIATSLPRERTMTSGWCLLVGGATVVAGVFTLVTYTPHLVPPLLVAGHGLTSTKVVLEYVILAIVVVTLAKTLVRPTSLSDAEDRAFLVALSFFGASELAFTGYTSAFDTVNALGHVLKVGSLAGVLIALVRGTVRRPFLELREAERTVRKSEAWFRSLLANASDMVTVVEPGGRAAYQTPAVTRTLGFEPCDLVGRPLLDLVHPDDHGAAADAIAAVFAAPGTPQRLEFRARHADGGWRWLSAVGQAFVDEDGRAIGVINSRDVTERKTVEERLRLQSAALNAAANAILIADRDGKIVWVNDAFVSLTGYAPDEVIGRTPRIFKSGRQPREFYEELWCTIVAGRPWHGTLVNARRDGTWYPEEEVITPVRADTAEITHFIAVKSDITERRRAEDERHREREALFQTEKLAGMGRLLAGVAHELNNPLAVVLGRTMLLGHALAGTPHAHAVEQLAAAADRCARIVKNFVALARQRSPERQDVDLNRVVQEAIELVAYSLRTDDVEIVLDLDARLPAVSGDPHELHQVLINLITNAHHAMREAPAARRLTITTRFDEASRSVVVRVTDTGPGIPFDAAARIFEPFFTTKPPGDGTGLGLAICQAIVEGHGGAIRAEPHTPPGATFVVALPAVTSPAPAPVAAPEPEVTITGKAILVVDDEPDVAAVVAEFLALDGHRVDIAADGVEALAWLAEKTFDVVVTDLKMPHLDGPGLYAAIRERHPGLAERVILLTGDTLGEAAVAFLRTLQRPMVAKPVELGALRRALVRVFGG